MHNVSGRGGSIPLFKSDAVVEKECLSIQIPIRCGQFFYI